jgi:Anti-sigma regulatory factor (Ser/Thr protein kinase)
LVRLGGKHVSVEGESLEPGRVPVQASINNELQLAVPMDVCSLCDLRWRTWAYLAAAGVAAGMMDDILIALHEAVANALTHSGASSDIAVRVNAKETNVVIEVGDRGNGMDPRVAIPPEPPRLTAEGGRGLFMIWSLMSSVQLVHANGTRLVMIKELYPPSV